MEGSSKKGKGLMGTHVSLDDCGARELGRGGRGYGEINGNGTNTIKKRVNKKNSSPKMFVKSIKDSLK